MPFDVGVRPLQRHRRFALRDRVVQREVGAQSVPVFYQRVRPKTQLRGDAIPFPIQHAVRIGHALVRGVATLFPAKIHRRIAGVCVFGRLDFRDVRAVFANKTFQTRSRLNQRAVGGEVFVARPIPGARQVIDLNKK